MWLNFQEALEKANLIHGDRKHIDGFLRARVGRGTEIFSGVGNVSYHDCGQGYVYIHLSKLMDIHLKWILTWKLYLNKIAFKSWMWIEMEMIQYVNDINVVQII